MTSEGVSGGFAEVEYWTYEVESPFRPPADIAALATRTQADESESQLEEAQRADLQLEQQEAAGGTSAVAEDPAYEWEYRWMADLHELGNAENSPYGEIELLEEVDRRSRAYAVWVQQSLNQVAGAGLATDGKIGPLSRAAIMRFQAARGLTADGIVGAKTEAALVAAGATAPPGATRTPAPGGSGTVTAPTPATVVTAAIPITVPAPCVEVPALPGPNPSCAGVDSTGFAGIAEVATFCGELADCYANRMAVRRQRERHAKAQDEAARAATAARVPNETRTARAQRVAAARAAVQPQPVETVRTLIRGSELQLLEEDFRDTIIAAGRRRRRTLRLRSVARMWMFGVRERVDFVTLDTSGRSLVGFAPPARPAGGDQLVDIEPPATTSGGAKVQPVMNTFLRELRRRAGGHSAYNYPKHGGGAFNGRGYSIDLELVGPKDERGFYQRPAAVQFLLAIDAAARAAGVQWRALYNDYAVAAAVNRHLDRKHVRFIGQIRRGRRGLGLNWHGPLLLHFHLDIAPLSPSPAQELEHVDPTAEFSPEALGDLEEPSESYAKTAGEYDLEDEWLASAEELDGFDEAEAFAADELDAALFEEEEYEEEFADEDEQPEQLAEQSALGTFETLVDAESGPGSSLADRIRGTATFVFGPTLRRGSRGPAVAALQRALGSLGYDVAADGDFGPATERAVRAAQGRLGLPVDGIVGPQTKSAIGAALSGGGQGAAAPSPGGPPLSAPAPATGASQALNGRILRVMELLVDQYGYPVNGAAGLVGNLIAESSVLPNRVEGSQAETPMRARDFANQLRDFTPEEIRDRSFTARRGPRRPGVGLAQWTSPSRRDGLFRHVFRGQQLGVAILFDLDAQVDYLVAELRGRRYASVNATLTAPGVTVDDAADDVVYRFEVPGRILENRERLPRSDPRVQEVFRDRRAEAHRALRVYRQSHPQ